MKTEHDYEVISQTINGKVCICSHCGGYHVDFKNLCFVFDYTAYIRFCSCFLNLEESDSSQRLKYPGTKEFRVSVNHRNLVLVFNREEIGELKNLLGSGHFFTADNHFIRYQCFEKLFSDN